MSERARRRVSWDEVTQLCERLAQDADEGYDAILAVARGGLVPAAIVAQRLGLRHILSAALASYQAETRDPEPCFLEFPDVAVLAGRRILVVDDIWDSGRTAVRIRQRLLAAGARPTIAVLHYKPESSAFPETRPELWQVETADWIVYPWEA